VSSGVSLVLGAFLLFAAWSGGDALFGRGPAVPAGLVPGAPLALGVAAAQAPPQGPAGLSGMPTLYAGSPASGTLSPTDPVRAEGAHYDDWSYRAEAGERFIVTMRSSQLDAYLLVGYIEAGRFLRLDENDDHAGETDAQLVVTAPEARDYVIRATSYGPGATGPYTLHLSTGPVTSPAGTAFVSDVPPLPGDASLPADYPGGGFVLGLLFASAGIVGLVTASRAPRTIRSAGKPMAEPRILYSLDSWQTVIFGAGDDSALILQRLLAHFAGADQTRFAFATERVWYWGLDGKTERDQLVLRYGRALVFCQVHPYGSDLYVGWNAQMNLGTWKEKPLRAGVDAETGERVTLMTVEHAVQPTNAYDLTDLNCLTEWTHAQIVSVLKHYLKEREIDQEIDFSIIRGERKGLTNEEQDGKDKPRRRFERKA
jgi:hypothetical protein